MQPLEHEQGEPPDVFADHISIAVGRYGVTISLYLTQAGSQGTDRPRLVGNVRLSNALAHDLSSNLLQQLTRPPRQPENPTGDAEVDTSPATQSESADVSLDPSAHVDSS